MSKNNWKQFTSLPLTLTVFSPMPMPRLPDPRIPWFLGAQSFTVNLEVSPKHPPILWKLPVQSFPSYRTGFQNTSSHLDTKHHTQISGYCTASETKLSGNTR